MTWAQRPTLPRPWPATTCFCARGTIFGAFAKAIEMLDSPGPGPGSKGDIHASTACGHLPVLRPGAGDHVAIAVIRRPESHRRLGEIVTEGKRRFRGRYEAGNAGYPAGHVVRPARSQVFRGHRTGKVPGRK